MKKVSYLIYLWLVCCLGLQAQSRREMGGIYYAYPVTDDAGTDASAVKAPAGFSPYYISHYGRHGSRWMSRDERYLWIEKQFADDDNLTPLGLQIKGIVKRICENAKGNGGKLTRLGELQHQGIARRMYAHYPQIFAAGHQVKARSSVSDRCAKSMLAFTSQLRSLQPQLHLDVKTDSADMAWIAYESPELKALKKRTKVKAQVSPRRFLKQLFKNTSKIDEPLKLMTEMYGLTSSLQDVGLNFPAYPQEMEDSLNALFTDAEFRAIYEANNLRMNITNGSMTANEEISARSAISLWQNIETEADAALRSSQSSATLRFGHDTALYRLLSLLFDATLPPAGAREDADQVVLGAETDRMDRVVPMGANLQMIFYKNRKDSVVVKFMLNERDIMLSPVGQVIYGTHYYSWKEWKQEMHQRIHQLEHVRQLYAIQTMGGAGQALPAVLVPNGQNFWTPQTRDSEQPCVTPYNDKDTQLQGFRCSHWPGGGEKRDYGSFTLAALGGKLRLQPAQRATAFSHQDEVSHPHYYGVQLKDEHLKAEMTALSHTSILRVTPDKDELVHLVIQPNNDDGQGTIEIDTVNHVVYAYNPAPHVYQGWGKPDDFGGHFVLAYNKDELVDYGIFDEAQAERKGLMMTCKPGIGVWLTFRGKTGKAMEWMSATSFTSRDQAVTNLNAENYMYGGLDFNSMMEYAANLWCERLHTIDVESQDTAKVNRFYTALYRSSFLPHELSDVGELQYGDFAMWDIYRAQLPLYHLLTPMLSGEMMQSLVKMYQDGVWMPIFPTANCGQTEMLGDDASIALADAYVKGIRNFDAVKAYEGMRMNAFSTPYLAKDYRSGKGRRSITSYMTNGYLPVEEGAGSATASTSRTLAYAYDDFAVAQMAKLLLDSCKDATLRQQYQDDYQVLMRRSENWRNVINPLSGWADGRYENGKWAEDKDLFSGKSNILGGSACQDTWSVPQNITGLFEVIHDSKPMDKKEKLIDKEEKKERKAHPQVEVLVSNGKVISRLDRMFDRGWYQHSYSPCHHLAYLYAAAGAPEKTQERVHQILENNSFSGENATGQRSAWHIFSSLGFYPACPGTPFYYIGTPAFEKVTLNLENGKCFEISAPASISGSYRIKSLTLNGKPLHDFRLSHQQILNGGKIFFSLY